jgi:nucleoside-diphosphate-sugar epimerase
MQSSNNRISLLIVGAHGKLGRELTKLALNDQRFLVNVLSKNMKEDDQCCKMIKDKGGKVWEADIMDTNSIRDVTKGVHTIISAIDGDEKTIFEGQMNLLNDGIRNGLKRFVPASYLADLSKTFGKEDDPILSYRNRFVDELKKTNVKGLFIYTGMFMETYFELFRTGELGYWGEESQKIDLISRSDAARFIITAVSDPDKSGEVYVTGVQMTVRDVADTLKKVRGKEITVKKLGGIEELRKEADKLRKEGNLHDAMKYLYALHSFDGKGKLTSIQNNQFPNVKPMNLENFAQMNPDMIKF